jgi:hypothetical protein
MRRTAALAVCMLLAACSTTKSVNMAEPRRVVGTDSDVRIDAEVYGDRLGPNVTLPVKYDITNHRQTTILIADLLPESTYDPDTHTVTIAIGAEIPGEEFLPRLIPIRSGERKSFTTAAHVVIIATLASPWVQRPNALRLKVNFLGNPAPFEKLIAIPERAVHDPALAAELFPKWVEGNETVVTNSLPMRWVTGTSEEPTPAAMPGRRKRGT